MDFLGMFMFFVPIRMLTVLNFTCCLAILTYLGQRFIFSYDTGMLTQKNSRLLRNIANGISCKQLT